MSTRRITFVAGTLQVGGAETQLVYMCRALLSAGHHVSVLTLEDGPNRQRIEALGVEVTQLTDGNGPHRRLPELLRRVRADRPDILQASHNWVNAYVALLGRSLRLTTVCALRGNPRLMQQKPPLRHPALLLPDLIASNSVENIELANGLGVSRKRLVHLPNAVDTDHYRPDPSLPADVPHVLGIGRLVEDKRFDLWLEVLHRLAERHAGRLRATLVGYGRLEDELRARAADLKLTGLVEFVQTHEPISHYQRADLLLFPSNDAEGMPNVVLESLSCGLPVVGFELGDVRSVVTTDDNGVLVPDGDLDALTQAADDIISDPERRDRLGAAARRRMVDHWSIDALADHLERVHRIAATPRRSR